MSQVSEIVVNWNPPDSGRAREIQIRSRIIGTTQWSPQGERIDPQLGEMRFTSNAPSTDVEVQARIVSVDNIPGDWFTTNITTAPAVVEYSTIGNKPSKLADINISEGTKLGTVAPGADKTSDNTAKDTSAVGGVPATTVTDAIKDTNGAVMRLRDILAAQDAVNGQTDQRIKDANSAITTAQKAATDAADAVVQEAADRAHAIDGVNQQLQAVAAAGGYDDTSVRTEIARVDRAWQTGDQTIGQTINTVKSSLSNTRGLTPNSEFRAFGENWSGAGWTYDGSSALSTVGATNVLRGGNKIKILDVNRGYRLHCIFEVIGAPCIVYVGLEMFDAAGSQIGNVYADDVVGQTFAPNVYQTNQLLKGSFASNTPAYRSGGKFFIGVDTMQLLFLANYGDNPVPGASVRIKSLWLEDVGSVELANATINQVATTAASANQAVGDLQTSVNTRFDGVNQTVGDINQRLTSVTNESGSTTSKVNTLTASAKGGGNLTPNSSLTTLDGYGFTFNADGLSQLTLNRVGAPYMIGGVENNLTLYRPMAGSGLCAEAQGPDFAVQGSTYIQFYALTASHRCNAWVSVFFYDGASNYIGYAGENFGARINVGGSNINAWDTTGLQCIQVPSTAIRARIVFRLYNVANDGYAWFSRPFVTQVQAGANTWMPYAAGSDRPVTDRANARLTSVETAVSDGRFAAAQDVRDLQATVFNGPNSNASVAAKAQSALTAVSDGRFGTSTSVQNLEATVFNGPNSNANIAATANAAYTATVNGSLAAASTVNQLRSEYDGTKATVTTQAGTLATVNSKTSAYVKVVADAGGRAGLSLWSDQYGGAWTLTGDGQIDGNLNVNGSITAQKIAPSAVQQVAFVTLNYTIDVPRG